MALGAVQSKAAGTSYAYRRTAGVREESDSDISFATKLTEEERKNAGEVSKSKDAGDGTDAAETVDLMQLIRERMEEIFVKVQNNDTEESFQIGGSSFTIKEWEEFLEKFDDAEDEIRELLKEEQAKRAGEAERTEMMKMQEEPTEADQAKERLENLLKRF